MLAEKGRGLVAAGHFARVVYLIIPGKTDLSPGMGRRARVSFLAPARGGVSSVPGERGCAKGQEEEEEEGSEKGTGKGESVCATCVITLAITPTHSAPPTPLPLRRLGSRRPGLRSLAPPSLLLRPAGGLARRRKGCNSLLARNGSYSGDDGGAERT